MITPSQIAKSITRTLRQKPSDDPLALPEPFAVTEERRKEDKKWRKIERDQRRQDREYLRELDDEDDFGLTYKVCEGALPVLVWVAVPLLIALTIYAIIDTLSK